ncbi:MAG: YciI family protein [Rhizobiales bacterium]|nr:YciI family protein [Hyphomicrobiales bacterium]
MLYAVLIYDDEEAIGALPKAAFDRLIANHEGVQDKLAADGKLGPVARLMPTTAAITLRQGGETVLLDGPFAETKERLLGLYVVDCASQEDAVEIACRLGRGETGGFAIRPLKKFNPGAMET